MKARKLGIFWLTLALALAGCGQAATPPVGDAFPQSPRTISQTRGALTPFHTPLPSATSPPPAAGTPTPLPSPTATPRVHSVARGETLGGLANLYGISVEALLAANPDINANAMSIGTQLVIPASATAAGTAEAPTLAPESALLGAPHCARTAEGGAWCFVPVRNPGESGLENVSAVVRMAAGGEIVSQVATSPLNVLAGGARTALAAYFPPPVAENFVTSVELLTALPQPPGDTRYLPALVEDLQVEVLPGGMTARVRGVVQVEGEEAVSVVWLAALALDAQGNPVGVRRYESGAAGAFDFAVYSSAGAISTVEVLVEARP